jgi:hypothetical protein
MQAIYDHTVTSELIQAADRARILRHPATVYLVTNEVCPQLWNAEKCYAEDYLGISSGRGPDFEANNRRFEAMARELLDAGGVISCAAVCRALGRKETWGKRYWEEFRARFAGRLEGERKVRWKVA